jgi:hypothetical protein
VYKEVGVDREEAVDREGLDKEGLDREGLLVETEGL